MSEPAECLPPSINGNVNITKARGFFSVFINLKEIFRDNSHASYAHVQASKGVF